MNSQPQPSDSLVFPEFRPGSVWLVGAGPGDPGLLTLLAAHALNAADAVVHDTLVSEAVLNLANPAAERVFAGKRGGKPSANQIDITRRLIELARDGRRVLRLKGGDPFIFGRGGEEAMGLRRAGVPFRIVPGITAGIAALTYAGIPATLRDVNQSITFLTGHDHTGQMPSALDWTALARGSQVLVMYMAVRHLGRIAEMLMAGGRPSSEPVTVISNATLPGMRVLETELGGAAAAVAGSGIEPPAIVCVGRVNDYRPIFNWIERG